MRTAVEQFIEQLEKQGDSWENVSIGRVQISIKVEDYLKLKEQAKAMGKEQMINFAKTIPIKTRLLQEGGTTYMRGDAELHYNQTFKQQEQ